MSDAERKEGEREKKEETDVLNENETAHFQALTSSLLVNYSFTFIKSKQAGWKLSQSDYRTEKKRYYCSTEGASFLFRKKKWLKLFLGL